MQMHSMLKVLNCVQPVIITSKATIIIHYSIYKAGRTGFAV